jgi:hypothetical protein
MIFATTLHQRVHSFWRKEKKIKEKTTYLACDEMILTEKREILECLKLVMRTIHQ